MWLSSSKHPSFWQRLPSMSGAAVVLTCCEVTGPENVLRCPRYGLRYANLNLIKMFDYPDRIMARPKYTPIFSGQLSAWSPNAGDHHGKFFFALAFPSGPIAVDRSSCLS